MLTTRPTGRLRAFQFQYFRPEGALPIEIAQQRPDFLLSDFNVYTFNIQLRDVSGAEGASAYEADLEVNAGYAQAEVDIGDTGIRAQFGVRYEDAVQTVLPVGANVSPTLLANDYFLPAATLTYNFAENMQLRLHASKTIARPQFRELAPQIFQDFESDREFTGNPFLQDSELFNAEARYEWYFARGQRFSLSGFYKRIDNPIEAAAFFAGGGQLRTGFANAPAADLYGAEVELQYYLPLESLGGFFSTRRLLLIGNYTYTQSKLKVDDSQIVGPDLQPSPPISCSVTGAADGAIGSSRQSADRHRGYGPDQPDHPAAHLCQRARDQSRTDPGHLAPAGPDREAWLQARSGRPRAGQVLRGRRRDPLRGAQPAARRL
jgi:outer membrane receptor protein involved in Fe transport